MRLLRLLLKTSHSSAFRPLQSLLLSTQSWILVMRDQVVAQAKRTLQVLELHVELTEDDQKVTPGYS